MKKNVYNNKKMKLGFMMIFQAVVGITEAEE